MSTDIEQLLRRTTDDVRAPADLLDRAGARRRRHVATRVVGGALAAVVGAGGTVLAIDLVTDDGAAEDVIIEPAPTSELDPDDGATDGEDPAPADGASDDTADDEADPDAATASPDTEASGADGATGADADLVPSGTALVADDEGVHVVDASGGEVRLSAEPAERAHDDGAGGFLVEVATDGPDAPSPAILWQELGANELVEVVPEALADRVRLHDGGLVDGSPAALFTVHVDGGDDLEAYAESVQHRLLPDGDRERIHLVNSFEGGFAAASLGDGLVASQLFSEASTSFEVRTLDGGLVDLPANPLGVEGCFDDIECPDGFAMSSDGERVAWLQRELDGVDLTTTLVVVERDGTPVTRVTLPAELVGEGIDLPDVDLDAGVALVNRRSVQAFDWEPALRVDLATGDVVELARPGHASVGAAIG